MLRRAVSLILASAVALGVLTGCRPEPQPSPSAPVFANEEEAFAAAEETYRAYVDALNQRRADPSSTPDPQSFLTGPALEVDIQTQQQLDQAGLAVTGSTLVARMNPIGADLTVGSIQTQVCLDSSATRVVNTDGIDVTPSDRDVVSLVQVAFLSVQSGLVIESSTTESLGAC